MATLVPVSPDNLRHAISYGLRFRRGKGYQRFSAITAELAAEALAEVLQQAGYVVMQNPPGIGAAQAAGLREREEIAEQASDSDSDPKV